MHCFQGHVLSVVYTHKKFKSSSLLLQGETRAKANSQSDEANLGRLQAKNVLLVWWLILTREKKKGVH